jgi:hypothetical protein
MLGVMGAAPFPTLKEAWMHILRAAVMAGAVGCLAAISCSSATGDGSQFGQGTGGAGGMLNLAGSGGVDIDAGAAGGTGSPCAQETQYVYVVTAANTFHRFDPPSLTFSQIGKLNCPNTLLATPFSMSVDRKGTAWVVFTSGKIYWVDIKTAECKDSGYVPNQSGFKTFGMGFSSDAQNVAAETLYVSQSDLAASVTGLARIDTDSMKLTPLGVYDLLPGRRAEMTGTGAAQLFGAFEGTPYVVAEIDKSNGNILSQAPQDAVKYAPNSSNFAFAHWGGDFWLFVGPGTSTDVFQYKPSDGTTAKVKTVSDVIVGAGVSTCAPLKPPA